MKKETKVAKKTVLVCDQCGSEVNNGSGASFRLNYTDAKRGSKAADLCGGCADAMPGHKSARRGRRPKDS